MHLLRQVSLLRQPGSNHNCAKILYRLQVQCCLSNTKEQWPPSCQETEIANLQAPWSVTSLEPKDPSGKTGSSGPAEYALQSIKMK